MADLQSAHRSFVGTACLYRDLAQRPRPFLQRNLNHILHAHARELERRSLSNFEGWGEVRPRNAPKEPFCLPWEYPDRTIMTELTKRRPLVLRIDSLQLRDTRGDDGTWRACPPQQVSSNVVEPEFDFLPTTQKPSDVTWSCVVHVSILDGEQDAHTRQAVVTQQRIKGTVMEWTDAEQRRVYQVILHAPFRLEVDSLLMNSVPSAASKHGPIHHPVIAKPYTLEIAIDMLDFDEARELLPRLDDGYMVSAPEFEAVGLKCLWTHLPDCPPAGQLIPLKWSTNHKSDDLLYGVDVSMGWSRRRDSPIAQYNRLRAAAAAKQRPQTPSSTAFNEPTSEQSRPVRYVFREGTHARVSEVPDLRCVFCEDKHIGSSLRLLRHHYVVNHDYFNFELQEAQEGDAGFAVFLMTRADRTAHGPAVADELRSKTGYSRVAPDEPYDMTKHLDGDDSWTRSDTERAAKKLATARMKSQGSSVSPRKQPLRTEAFNQHKPVQPTTHTTPAAGRQPSIAEILLDDVVDLPERPKYNHRLPKKANGVEFYHLISRQPIQLDDHLDRSDDELEDQRLAPAQRQVLASMGMSKAEQEYHQAFNLYLDHEQPESAILAQGAVLRFWRNHQQQLRNAEWRDAFLARVKHLREHRILPQEIENYCLRKLLEGTEDVPVERDEVNGHEGSTKDALHRPANSVQRKRKRGQNGARTTNGSPNGLTDTPSKSPMPASENLSDRTDTASRPGTAGTDSSTSEDSRLQRDAAGQSSSHKNDSDKDDETRKDSPTSRYTSPSALKPVKKPPRACYCGIRTEDDLIPRRCVVCDNPRCPRGTFHMACVGVTTRLLDWQCKECAL